MLFDATPRMFNHHRGLWGYTGVALDGEPLTVQSTGMGGPSAAIVLAELPRSACGARCGSAAPGGYRRGAPRRVETSLLESIKETDPGTEAGAEFRGPEGVEHAAWTNQREVDVEQNELGPLAHRPGR